MKALSEMLSLVFCTIRVMLLFMNNQRKLSSQKDNTQISFGGDSSEHIQMFNDRSTLVILIVRVFIRQQSWHETSILNKIILYISWHNWPWKFETC